MDSLKKNEISKIIITRPVVMLEEDLGHLPGNLIDKMSPWVSPIIDILNGLSSVSCVKSMLVKGSLEMCPLMIMRGRSFSDSLIIGDEMQNSSVNQMKMLVTRIGKNSRLVITGDLNQSDLINKQNGLLDLITRLNIHNKRMVNEISMIKLLQLENNDIERSDIAKKVIELYDDIKIKQPNYANLNNEDKKWIL
jgi:phosphate starvation-inducible PhoH-like protein